MKNMRFQSISILENDSENSSQQTTAGGGASTTGSTTMGAESRKSSKKALSRVESFDAGSAETNDTIKVVEHAHTTSYAGDDNNYVVNLSTNIVKPIDGAGGASSRAELGNAPPMKVRTLHRKDSIGVLGTQEIFFEQKKVLQLKQLIGPVGAIIFLVRRAG